ncbi:cation transport protein-domain-containing protein [Chaetomium strumarium]|uniref:peptidylprolyl isomerase n=1 Tax=Chaetomium strumarium TaxID=1170767 RepID=A0AAJ0M1I5_9PEZI|nr:cation transport protein-domain-containing protein [Chaetomium strumarium]
MQRVLLSLSLLASVAAGALASDELKIDVTLPVECERKTQKGDTINVHYRGTLQSNGQKFDASYDRGTPFSFKLGAGMVIKGWDEGLLDMCIGEKRTLTIAPSYGYGDRSVGPIPAGSTLVFETELMGINGVPKPESIVTKSSAGSTDGPASSASQKVAEKVVGAVSGAAEAVKTVVADTDDRLTSSTFLAVVRRSTPLHVFLPPTPLSRMRGWHHDRDDGHSQDASTHLPTRAWLPPLNFITIHYAYFIVVCLVASVIFWGSSDPPRSISYTDSLFLVVSAMTEAGLNTVNLSRMTTWQQTILFLLIILGSSIWVSIWTVVARKRAFEQRFQDIVRAERMRRASRPGSAVSLPRLQRFLSLRKASTAALPQNPPTLRGDERTEQMDIPSAPQPAADRIEPAGALVAGVTNPTMAAAAAQQERPLSPARIIFVDTPRAADAVSTAAQHRSENQLSRRNAGAKEDHPSPYEKYQFGMRQFLAHRSGGRNAQFHGLTVEEREHLGGCEYRAIRVLSVIVPLYFVLWQLLGCLVLGAWINNNQPEPPLRNGIHPWWLGIFNGVSAFNNSGMSLLDANMIPFQNSYLVLITMGLMILAGNTAYPIFLRLIIWSLSKFPTPGTNRDGYSGLKDTFKFILQYPRRVYTNLFPARPTWWLLFMLILLNSVDWAAFELLNLGNPSMDSIPRGSRVLDGLFQALVMMYISVYPVVITMRHSNVYEERSLGIYAEDEVADVDPETATPRSVPDRRRGDGGIAAIFGRAVSRTLTLQGVGARAPPSKQSPESNISFISQQIHGQLAHDIWWLVLAVLVIATINTSNFLADPVNFSVFNVMFEVVSAYGCVGISVGVPYDAFSFCGSWPTASKLVLCVVMLRGRHRGLPVALDRAVRLPGEALHDEEEEDHRIRRSLTHRRTSVDV